jgi:hypothetical protein
LIAGVMGESWSTVNNALRRGHRGLPTSTTLARLLAEHRGRKRPEGRPELSVVDVLRAADAYHAQHRSWPREKTPGPIPGWPRLHWSTIDDRFKNGRRGLPGPTTLLKFLIEHRGREARNRPPDLSVEQILAWADAYHEAHGRWPGTQSGKVAGAESETWLNINFALAGGHRGLPGGSSLCRLLSEHRGVHNPKSPRDLSAQQVLAWADAHRAATGTWPTDLSGAVAGTDGEVWSALDLALKKGGRGLPRGSSLKRLLDEHRGEARGRLTLDLIRAWGEAYRTAHGSWPDASSGRVDESPTDTWYNINKILGRGGRGLPGHSSLQRLLGEHRGLRYAGMEPELNPTQIVTWAEAHHAATGKWPAH